MRLQGWWLNAQPRSLQSGCNGLETASCYLRETRETCAKSVTSKMGESSRSEVRGFRNFELRTSNFGSRTSGARS